MENTIETPTNKKTQLRDPSSTVCQKCKSEDTKSFAVIYSEGTTSGTLGAGSYTIGGGVTLTQGKVSSQSALALQTQPPEEPDFNILLLIGVVIGAFVISMIIASFFDSVLRLPLGIAVTVLAVVGGYLIESRRFKFHKEKYQKDIAAWKRSWMCMRCGHTWRRVPVN